MVYCDIFSGTNAPVAQRASDITGCASFEIVTFCIIICSYFELMSVMFLCRYAASPVIGDSQKTAIQALLTGPLLLMWYWQVSSEPGHDFLSLSIDAVSNYQQSISGNVSSWTYATQCVLPGQHNFSFVYQKDASGSAGLDRGFVDYVMTDLIAHHAVY